MKMIQITTKEHLDYTENNPDSSLFVLNFGIIPQFVNNEEEIRLVTSKQAAHLFRGDANQPLLRREVETDRDFNVINILTDWESDKITKLVLRKDDLDMSDCQAVENEILANWSKPLIRVRINLADKIKKLTKTKKNTSNS